MRHINDKGLAIIKEREGLRLEKYLCPAGYWTIGYGHRILDDEWWLNDPITEELAEVILRKDCSRFECDVESLVKVPISDNAFSALVSFAYNTGSDIDADTIPEGLGDSKLLEYLNAGEYQKAADEFPKWRKGGGKVLKGLVIRRAQERSLFLETPHEG